MLKKFARCNFCRSEQKPIKCRPKISGRSRKNRTMDNVWHPSGLERLFFSHSNYNQWKRPSQETDIYVNIANWPAEINVVPLPLIRFSSQNCQMFHIHLCSGTGSTVMWILQRFFPDTPPPSCLTVYSVPALLPQLQTPAEQNDCRVHDAHYLRRGGLEEKLRCWHRCVLCNNREVVHSCEYVKG